MERVLLDSNIIIALSQGKINHEILKNYMIAVSDISRLEVLGYHKISAQELNLLEKFFQNINVIPITSEIMNKAIEERRVHNMSVGDAIIAATCLNYNLTLLTANVKDFIRLEALRVLNPL